MFAAKMEAAHPPAPQEIDLLLSLLSETVNGSPGSSSAAHPLRFESSDASSEGLRVEYADSGQEPHVTIYCALLALHHVQHAY